MRAISTTAIVSLMFFLSQPALAEPSVTVAATSSPTAAAKLAAAAAREAQRLGTTARTSDDRGQAAGGKLSREEAYRARLAAAERLRIRSKYRELQLQRVVAQSAASTDNPEEISSSD